MEKTSNKITDLKSAFDTGAYIGYVWVDPAKPPNLYFEKGCLIQQSADKDDLGWHPKKERTTDDFVKKTYYSYRGANITFEAATKYISALETLAWSKGELTPPLSAFISEFLSGAFDDHELQPTSVFFECDSVDYSWRLSLRLLVKPTDSYCLKEYKTDELARAAVVKAQLANNETPKKKKKFFSFLKPEKKK